MGGKQKEAAGSYRSRVLEGGPSRKIAAGGGGGEGSSRKQQEAAGNTRKHQEAIEVECLKGAPVERELRGEWRDVVRGGGGGGGGREWGGGNLTTQSEAVRNKI